MRRKRLSLCLAVAVGLYVGTARADIQQAEENPSTVPESDLLFTNTADLAALYLQGNTYPCGVWVWPQDRFFQPMLAVWANITSLPAELAGLTNSTTETVYGIPAWPLWVTLYPQSNTVTVLQPWSGEVLTQFSVNEDFPSWSIYQQSLYPACILNGINYTNREVLVDEGYTQFATAQVTVHAWLMDITNQAAYWNNVQAEADALNAEAAGTSTAFGHSGRFTPLDEEPDFIVDGDPCSVTNLIQAFQIVSITINSNRYTSIVWESCPRFLYGVFSVDALNSNLATVAWQSRAYLWGWPNTTTWTDMTTSNAAVSNRFYRVERLPSGSLMAAGALHSLALRPDGTLWAWGNNQGQLGDLTSEEHDAPELIGPSPCGRESISNAVVLAGGYQFSTAVDANGLVWTWGNGPDGELGNGDEDNTQTYEPFPIDGVSNIVSVSSGATHSLALRGDGSVFAWGANQFAQLGVLGAPSLLIYSPMQATGLAQIVAIAAGGSHSVALDANAKVWTWGEGDSGQLGIGGTPTSNAIPTLVTNLPNVIAIATGFNHTIALTTNQTVWTWGDNSAGELARTGDVTRPGPVNGLSNIVAIAGGDSFTLAVTSNGQVFAWGDNGDLQLGTNGIGGSSTPLRVAGLSNAIVVAASSSDGYLAKHSLIVTAQGGTLQYWAFGEDDDGQVGNGTNGVNQSAPYQLQFTNAPCSCIQLGTSGTFTATATGTLKLYFNDNLSLFGDNSGAYSVTITNLGSVSVPATTTNGVVIGTVTNGLTHMYIASGISTNCGDPHCGDNPNGADPDTGILKDCPDTSNYVCPGFQCYSLVGKIQ